MEDFDLEKFAREHKPVASEPAGLIAMRQRTPKLEVPVDEEGKRLSLSSDPPGKIRVRPSTHLYNFRPGSGAKRAAPDDEQPKKKKHKRSRSEGSRRNRAKKEAAKLGAKARCHRADESRRRHCLPVPSASATMNTKLCFFPRQLLCKPDGCPKEVRDFYVNQPMCNQYVEVTEGCNVSNPFGEKGKGKGVRAIRDIPMGIWICPYLAEFRRARCPSVAGCVYDMKLGRDTYLCAANQKYDLGYFYGNSTGEHEYSDRGFRKNAILEESPCPPNYARYVNSLTAAQLEAGMTFNCRFVTPVETEIEVFVEATRDIAKGEELLCEYGDEFTVG